MEMMRMKETLYRIDRADQLAAQLLEILVAAGAKFYRYCGQEIMYLDGWVTDLFRKEEFLQAMEPHVTITDMTRANAVHLSFRRRARALAQPIPEEKLGKIGGVEEPPLRMTKSLRTPVRFWLRAVIESGRLN
jgi:hypothetical protein